MLFFSDEEVKNRLEAPTNVIEKTIHDHSRGNGNKNKSPELRALAGSLAKVIGGKAVSELLPVSGASANNYAKGKIAPVNGVDEELKAKVDERTSKIANTALNKLLSSLEAINTLKLSESSPKEASSVAKDLATVIEKTSAKNDNPTNVNVIIYAPKRSQLDDYDTIEITAVNDRR